MTGADAKNDLPNLEVQCLTRPDGRRVGYAEYGDPSGLPVFYLHGMPGSRLEGALLHAGARCNGIRLICMDRPGIGHSDFCPGYRLTDFPEDLARLADHLGLDDLALLGWSSGGPPALACALAFPERLRAVLVMASYTNFGEDPAALRLMWDWGHRVPALAPKSQLLFRTGLRMMQGCATYLPQLYLNYVRRLVSPSDQRILAEPAIGQRFMRTQTETFRQGIDGIFWDLYLEYVDWGFRLEQVEYPVQLIQGRQDPFVPWTLAARMAQGLPQARVHYLASAGHLFPLDPAWQFLLWARLRELWRVPTTDFRGPRLAGSGRCTRSANAARTLA